MKPSAALPGILCFLWALASGCASPPRYTPHPDTAPHLLTLAGSVWTFEPTGRAPFDLEPRHRDDPEYLRAVETILLRHSHDDRSRTRITAGRALLFIGSDKAWDRALEMAQKDPRAEVRASTWQEIILCLDIGIRPGSTEEPYFFHPAISIYFLPPSFDETETARKLLAALTEDSGYWTETRTHRHPFIPFYNVTETRTQTVRNQIATSLQRMQSPLPAALREGLESLLQHPDPKVSEAAEQALTSWF